MNTTSTPPNDAERRNAPASDESGAATTLEFMLTIPLLVFVVVLCVETTQLLVARVGTSYAAFAAARTAAVRYGVGSADVSGASHRSAVQALVPFASAGPRRAVGRVATRYAELLSAEGVSREFVAARFAHVDRATSVRPDRVPGGATVRVVYRHPIRTSVLGRVLGRWDGTVGAWVVDLETSCRVTTARPGSSLGIDYEPRR